MKNLITVVLVIILNSTAYADIFCDGSTSNCSNGSTSYSTSTRSCGSGSHTVYTTPQNAHDGVSAGTSGNPTVINMRQGTHIMSSRLTITKDYLTWQKYDSNRPVLDANWSSASAFQWNGIITVRASYNTFDGLEIRNGGYFPGTGRTNEWDIGGYGIYVTSQSGGPYVGGVIKNCYIHHIGGSCVNLRYGSDYWDVDDNLFQQCNYSKIANPPWHNWGSAVWTSHATGHVNIRRNIAWEQGGEGFNLNAGTHHALVEDNVLYDVLRPAIYPSGAQDSIIRRNLVYSTGFFDSHNSQYEIGIGISAENYPSPTSIYVSNGNNVDVYENRIAHMDRCIAMAPSHTGRTISNTNIYNNTCIASTTAAFTVATDSNLGSGNVVANNIFDRQSGDLTGGTPNQSKFTFKYNAWSATPPSNYQGAGDDYGTIDRSAHFAKSGAWTQGESLDSADFNLVSPAPMAVDDGTGDAFYLANINKAVGSAPDRGADELGGGADPVDPGTLIYTMDTDGTDTGGGGENMSAVGGSPTHSAGALVISSGTDAGYARDLSSDWDVNQITVIAEVTPTTLSSGETHPIVGRWNVDNGKNWAMVNRYNTPTLRFRIGTNGGASNENIDHTYTQSTSTKYYYAAILDGSGKTISLYLFNTSGNSLGTDIENQAVLSGAVWNNAETNLSAGFWYDGASKSSTYVAHANIGRIEIYSELLNKSTISARIIELEGGGAPSNPTINVDCFATIDGTCLSSGYNITTPDQWFCRKIGWTEPVIADEGAGTVAGQVTFALTNSLTLPYYSGYNSDTWLFCEQSDALQRFGSIQAASSDPISLGTISQLEDVQGNAATKSGVSTSESITFMFHVETKAGHGQSSNAQQIGQTSSGQPVEQ